MNKFNGTVAIITGAASGIGRALAELLAKSGAAVIIADINGKAASEAAEEIIKAGGKAEAAALDVTDAQAVKKFVDETFSKYGRIDYMFNNAGVGIIGEARDMSLEDWNRILAINLRGVIHGVHAVYPLMIEQGFGHIVNTSSINGLAPFPLSVAYSATKHAVLGMTTSLRTEAKGLGVKVSAICPGFIDTPMKDSNLYLRVDKEAAMKELPFKLHPAEKCARDILAGVSKNKAIVVITPQAKLLWWLYRLSPWLFIRINEIVAVKSRRLRTEK